jgi:hypothetical protein
MGNKMVNIHVENIKDTLSKILSSLNLSLLSGSEVEVKPGVFIKLVGNLDFSIKSVSQGIEINFKIQPHVRVVKFLSFNGDLEKALITKNGIILNINGLPDVFLEAIS